MCRKTISQNHDKIRSRNNFLVNQLLVTEQYIRSNFRIKFPNTVSNWLLIPTSARSHTLTRTHTITRARTHTQTNTRTRTRTCTSLA